MLTLPLAGLKPVPTPPLSKKAGYVSPVAFAVWLALFPVSKPATAWAGQRSVRVLLADLLTASGLGTLLRLELGLYELQLRGALQSYTLEKGVLTVKWLGALERLFRNVL